MSEFSRATVRPSTQGHLPGSAETGWLRRTSAIMGTEISVELWCDDPQRGNAAIDAVMQEMHRIDFLMSPYKPESELSLINRLAATQEVAICPEMTSLIQRAIEFSKISNGSFDITYAAVGRLFDYRERQRPTAEQIELARQAIGYQHLLLDPSRNTIRFAKPGVCIDLGGFAKGHAVDNAARIFRKFGITHANVSAGGDSRVIGDRRGRPWMIGVRDPREAGKIIAMLPLVDTSISTSGDYERFFDEGGVRYHHLIDPFTGQSPNSVRSVTILAEDGLTTEAYSKMVFVLGLERGMKLVEARRGVDAVVVDANGKLHYSAGLMNPA